MIFSVVACLTLFRGKSGQFAYECICVRVCLSDADMHVQDNTSLQIGGASEKREKKSCTHCIRAWACQIGCVCVFVQAHRAHETWTMLIAGARKQFIMLHERFMPVSASILRVIYCPNSFEHYLYQMWIETIIIVSPLARRVTQALWSHVRQQSFSIKVSRCCFCLARPVQLTTWEKSK